MERPGMGRGMMPVKNDQSGFSLIETVVALGILATGLLGLAGVFTLGLAHMATSSANLVAREKAREAVESVHTARDTGLLSWDKINNDDATVPGVFLHGPQSLYKPGPDGLVGTADDDDLGTAGLEMQQLPGPDGILGNTDDVKTPMTNYTRTIVLSPLNRDDGTVGVNIGLRLITVTIAYSVGPVKRTYTLTTYISAVS
jgi:prepilin-type N-terminal cleavage/methylation domain-containing protein